MERKTLQHIFRLFADILKYPAPGLLERAKECEALVSSIIPIAAACLKQFSDFLERTPQGKIEEIYTSTFDLQCVCYPYAGYHLFGESYKRGIFMARLKEHYLAHGFRIENDLPDHISLLLRFLSFLQEDRLYKELTQECIVPSLRKMMESIVQKNNPYYKAIESLLFIFEHQGVGTDGTVPILPERIVLSKERKDDD